MKNIFGSSGGMSAKQKKDLEKIALANTSMLSKISANVLYSLDGTALTAEDGTRELKNKALHSDSGNGKLNSGNPLDFQGSNNISIPWNKIAYVGTKTKFTFMTRVVLNGAAGVIFSTGYSSSFLGMDLSVSSSIITIKTSYNKASNENRFLVYSIPVDKVVFDIAVQLKSNKELSLFVDGLKVDSVILDIPSSGLVFESSQELSIGAYRSSSSFLDASIDYLVLIDSDISESEIKRFIDEPEKALTDYGTKPELKGVFVTDFSGKEDFIYNMCNPITTDVNFDVSNFIINNKSAIKNIATIDENNVIHYVCNPTDDAGSYPIVSIKNVSVPAGSLVLIDATLSNVISGGVKIDVGTKSLRIKNGKNLYQYDTTVSKGISMYRTSDTTDLNIKINSIHVVTGGAHQIKGYHPTQRTNFIKQTMGLQQILLEKNQLGFSTKIAEGLYGDSKSNIDTNFLPSQDKPFSLEAILGIPISGFLGIGEGYNKVRLLRNTAGRTYFQINQASGGIIVNDSTSSFVHAVLSYDGKGSYSAYLNGKKLDTKNDMTVINFQSLKIFSADDGNNEGEGEQYSTNIYNIDFSELEIFTLYNLRKLENPKLNLGA